MPELKNNLFVDGGQDVSVPAHLNFGKYMFDNIRRFSDEVAVTYSATGEQLTYKNLTQRAVNLSLGLTKLGIGKGDIVILGIHNDKSIDYVPTVFGVIFTGATICPVRVDIGKAILKHRLQVVSPTCVICSGIFWENYYEILEEVGTVKVVVTLDDKPKSAVTMNSLLSRDADVEMFTPAEVRGQEDVAVIYYSSGTTGLPKAIQLTHLNCILHCLPDDYNQFATASHQGWTSNYFDFKAYLFLANGKNIVHIQYTEIDEYLNAIDKYKVEVAFSGPRLINILLNSELLLKKYDLNSLKIIFSRSSPLHKKSIAKLKNLFPKGIKVFQGYGMTECGELCSEMRCPEEPEPGSVGRPSRGIILKIVDLQTGENLPPNQNGEICVKGAAVMKGYVNVDPSTYCDNEGFFRTGDLGSYDENGNFYIIDRLKDILKVGGYKVAPVELETILQLHPSVQEAGIVGKPDKLVGEVPIAFIVRKPGSNVSEQELIDYLAAQVTPYMQLKGGVVFISELPRNSRGKILKNQLRDMLKVKIKEAQTDL